MKDKEIIKKCRHSKDYTSLFDFVVKYILRNNDVSFIADEVMAKDIMEYIIYETQFEVFGTFSNNTRAIMISKIGNKIILENSFRNDKLLIGIDARKVLILESVGLTEKEINTIDCEEIMICNDIKIIKKKDIPKRVIEPVFKSEMITNYISDEGFGNEYCESYYLDTNDFGKLLGDILSEFGAKEEDLINELVEEYSYVLKKATLDDEGLKKLLLELIQDVKELYDN